jgi:DNA uptake protein ComE-like DNA-binding protein
MSKRNTRFYIKEYLTFSRSERNGIIVLLTIIFIALILKYLIPYIIPQRSCIDVSKFESEIVRFEQACDSAKNIRKTIPTKPKPSNFSTISIGTRTEPIDKIEINIADSSALDKLPGIGPAFAHRIIKYRCILGGFYSLNQLYEVYGIKPETIRKIEKYLVIDTFKIQKIAINTAGFKEINAHPYISYEQTKAICKRRSKQKFESLIQLTEAGIFSVDELEKIRPYLIIY